MAVNYFKKQETRTPYESKEATLVMPRALYRNYLTEGQKKNGMSAKEQQEVNLAIGREMGIKYPVARIDLE